MNKPPLPLFYYIIISCFLLSCSQKYKIWNNEFKEALNNYYSYVDSVNYKQGFDYIYIEATQNRDSVLFLIYLCGGSYDFINEKDKIIDFYSYKGKDILFVGDFPNNIMNIQRNIKLNVIDDIVKVRYPEDYIKYLEDEHSVGPLIYDYMDMTLTFKHNKLISCKRQYY
jgi:hypothetical protein